GDLSVALALSLRPAVLDRDSAALVPAKFTQPFHEGANPTAPVGRSARAQEAYSRQRWLLRARRNRPRRRAADKRDELPPPHSITSSASCWRCRGTSRPIAFAVLRLITSSNLVGACAGRSAGFAPLRMRSTYEAERRKISAESGPYDIRPPSAANCRN